MIPEAKHVVLGKITSAYGVKGWVKVYSYTQPKENICQYKRWDLQGCGRDGVHEVTACKPHSNGLVAHIKGCGDRNAALQYSGALIRIPCEELPELPEGEFYWYQLQGLDVLLDEQKGQSRLLGRVSHLIETGSNDVLVVKKCPGSIDAKERLIPYLPEQVVKEVNLAERYIKVDWDPDF